MIWLIVVVLLVVGLLLVSAAVAMVWKTKSPASADADAMSFKAGKYAFEVATESLAFAVLGVVLLAFALYIIVDLESGSPLVGPDETTRTQPTLEPPSVKTDPPSSEPESSAVEDSQASKPTSQSIPPDEFVRTTITLTADDAFALFLNGERVGDSWSATHEEPLVVEVGQSLQLTTTAPMDGSEGGVRLEFRQGNSTLGLPATRWETAAVDDVQASPDEIDDWNPAATSAPSGGELVGGFRESTPWLWNHQASPGQIIHLRTTLTPNDLKALGLQGGSGDATVVVAGIPTFTLDSDGATLVASWMRPTEFPVSLQPGTNIIAVEAMNAAGPAGLLVSVEGFPNAVSGTSWSVTDSRPAGDAWRSDPDLDLLNWVSAAVAGLDGIATPWSKIIREPLVHPAARWIWVDRAGSSARRAQLYARLVLDTADQDGS